MPPAKGTPQARSAVTMAGRSLAAKREATAGVRRSKVAILLDQGMRVGEIAEHLGASEKTIRADRVALLGDLADDDAALMARRDLAERVAILALAQLEDLNAQVNARFELPEQDPPTIPTE